jgi:hypothetical protein
VRVQCLRKPEEFRVVSLSVLCELLDDGPHGPRTQAIVAPPSVPV